MYRQDIEPTRHGRAELQRLWPVDFTRDGRAMSGFIAEEVEVVVPDAVSDVSPPDGIQTKALDPLVLPTVAVSTIQEQGARIAALEAQIGALQAQQSR